MLENMSEYSFDPSEQDSQNQKLLFALKMCIKMRNKEIVKNNKKHNEN